MNGPTNTRRFAAYVGLPIIPALAWQATGELPAWVTMWALAGSMFFALKLLTLTAVDMKSVSLLRRLAYVALWPGMDARAFLADRTDKIPVTHPGELASAMLKLLGKRPGTSPQ